MSKNVLIISSSPRKGGNSDTPCEQFRLENKEFYLIVTAADGKAAMERTIDGLRGYLECLPGAKEMGVIYGAEAWQLGDIQGNSAMWEAYQMGKSIC